MKRNAMRKNLRQSIFRSLGRYLAIVMIIALGSSMFVGLLMTKSDMVATGQQFMDQHNMFDLRLVSTYGWGDEDVDAIAQMEGVVDAEGLRYLDLLAHVGDSTEDSVYRFYALPQKVNTLALCGGRMPERPDECLADGYHTTDAILGTKVTVSDVNDADSLEGIQTKTFTVVGYVSTPLYMDMNRGTTSVGNGSLSSYFYILPECFDLDYYAEVHVTLPGDFAVYTQTYNDAMEAAAETLEPMVKPLAQNRMEEFRQEALDAYEDGLAEYEDGLRQFEEGKLEAQQELDTAYQSLTDAEARIQQNTQLLQNGQQQIAESRATLDEGEKALEEGRAEFDSAKATAYAPLDSAQAALDVRFAQTAADQAAAHAALEQINGQIETLNQQIAPLESQLADLDQRIAQLDRQISGLDSDIRASQAALEVAKLFPNLNAELIAWLESSIASMQAQRDGCAGERQALADQRWPIAEQLAGPQAERNALLYQQLSAQEEVRRQDAAMAVLQSGQDSLNKARGLLDQQFAGTEEELLAAEEQLKEGRKQLEAAEAELAAGWAALEQGKEDLADGWADYEDGKRQFEEETAKAEQELADAKEQLDEAKEIIDSMTEPEVFLLDRNSNIGYNSLDSSSNIVQGVSRVFPAFFLLVAALVCITTMTRMIDEERTQIGTLKALGYSNQAIINKYLFYAGSGAVVGCGLGTMVGSVVFPKILWEAYKIMLFITDDIVLKFNWWLCGAVVGAYTAVMLFVTWFCCRRELREVPAELIRPKAPDAGKKILLEYLPFWNKISFLNKVTIRNIFRYRQRLAMMMVGIGGCTALLVTGFGLRDSVVNVVEYQFEEVTTYDMTVYFTDGQTPEEQADFLKDLNGDAQYAMFYHQSSIDLDYNNQVKEIYLIASDSGIQNFINMHSGDNALPMPGKNEVMLSVGVSEAMGIRVGDTVRMRNADMQVLDLTVSGIYDNHVYNYAIVTPDTIQAQWGEAPQMQMAFVTVKEGQDPYQLSTRIIGMSDVMNVSVSEDLAEMVGNMMDALDLVVIVIVFCAGALAVIVLYNLTNININERIREIATIKVLGFNSMETALYIFKENLSLSVIGSALGLGLGYLLLLFVMSQIKIDMVWFKSMVLPMSYVWSIVLTMLSAFLVDFVFYFKLEKINMAEALKSVE